MSIGKKNLLNSITKWRKKPKDLINKKPFKLDKKIRRKTNHLLLYNEKLLKPSSKTGKKTWY